MSNDEPQMPKAIAVLEWFRRHAHRYWISIILLLSLVANLHLYVALQTLRHQSFEYRQATEKLLTDYHGCRTKSPYGDPPLQVGFSDGETAYVNFYTQMLADEYRASTAASDSRAYIAAYESALNSTKAVVYAILEQKGLSEVRVQRTPLAAQVIETTNAALERAGTGFTLVQFEFLEFCAPKAQFFAASDG